MARTAVVIAFLQITSTIGWLNSPTYRFSVRSGASQSSLSLRKLSILRLSDWSSFQVLDDEDDIDSEATIGGMSAFDDDSEDGNGRRAPSIERPAQPIQVPPGSKLELSEDVVLGVLSACREELGTLFGYTVENRDVGITGGVDYVDLDGPSVIIKLKGRFWHERSTVLERVSNYLRQRIPEIVDVDVEDPWQLTDEANDIW